MLFTSLAQNGHARIIFLIFNIFYIYFYACICMSLTHPHTMETPSPHLQITLTLTHYSHIIPTTTHHIVILTPLARNGHAQDARNNFLNLKYGK